MNLVRTRLLPRAIRPFFLNSLIRSTRFRFRPLTVPIAALTTASLIMSAEQPQTTPATTSQEGQSDFDLKAPSNASSLFEFSALNSKKKRVDLSEYKGKVVLVVNVASKCGFTPQYKGLEALYKDLKDQGLVILGFPCNGFGSQEPGSEAEIESFCSLNYGVSFPIMAKIEVNGDNEHPVYHFLKSQKSGLLGLKRIKWNFEKFLVGKDGKVVERYSSLTKPEEIRAKIEELLKA